MSAYADPAPNPLQPMTAPEISRMFGKPDGWFTRDRVRKRLYAKGFPHPLERGLWSRSAVAAWMSTAGSNPTHEPPRAANRRRTAQRRRANGYAPLREVH